MVIKLLTTGATYFILGWSSKYTTSLQSKPFGPTCEARSSRDLIRTSQKIWGGDPGRKNSQKLSKFLVFFGPIFFSYGKKEAGNHCEHQTWTKHGPNNYPFCLKNIYVFVQDFPWTVVCLTNSFEKHQKHSCWNVFSLFTGWLWDPIFKTLDCWHPLSLKLQSLEPQKKTKFHPAQNKNDFHNQLRDSPIKMRQKEGLRTWISSSKCAWCLAHSFALRATCLVFDVFRMVKVGGVFVGTHAKNAYQNSESSGETHSFGDSKREPSSKYVIKVQCGSLLRDSSCACMCFF